MAAAGDVQFERDIRSASRPFKRDRDHRKKWSMGMSPSSGVHLSSVTLEPEGGSESQRNKVVPMKQYSQMTSRSHKSNRNRIPKASTSRVRDDQIRIFGRLTRKADSHFEIQSHTSILLCKALLENNTATGMDGFLISNYDSSSSRGAVDLGDLVEHAERKWESIQTERIVKDEYEVLDNEGETTVLRVSKGTKGKRRNTVIQEDDDGFELI
ncbi:hypothetical protein BT96DRAFT_915490 [Gymnopus androsaceus JB14]|uniref:Uncharacterized protein n=1 Tax=Gymnopus androsaceus JB14 TaxID=1447944 RepID=A0A6A4I8G4_9AGAR|nr:hypothetical protein BT96DRAFT_915490 [Gymnopus androsaceus JB14]